MNKTFETYFIKAAPWLFVLLWSTGWIVGRYSSMVGEPLSMLSVRFALAIAVMAGILWGFGVKLPRNRTIIIHAFISGILLHTLYLGGVWYAIYKGLPTPVSGVIAAVQPVLTAVLAPLLLAEKISIKQAWGIFLGFAGIICVLLPKLMGVDSVPIFVVFINLGAMISVTLGTFYQKKFLQGQDLRATAFLQYIGALVAILPLVALTENFNITWNMTTFFTLLWSVLALSIGAVGLLLYLLNKGEVSRSAALIFLVPPTTAIEAYFLFGDTLSPLQIGGMVITVFGVYLATRK